MFQKKSGHAVLLGSSIMAREPKRSLPKTVARRNSAMYLVTEVILTPITPYCNLVNFSLGCTRQDFGLVTEKQNLARSRTGFLGLT